MRLPLPVVAVALLVVLAGCGGTTGSTPSTAAPSSKAPTTTPGGTTHGTQGSPVIAPGVTTYEVVDAFALADAHRATLQNTSYTAVRTERVRYANGTLAASRTTKAFVNHSTDTVLYTTSVTDPAPRTYPAVAGTSELWANDTVSLARSLNAGDVQYRKSRLTRSDLAVRATHWEDLASLLIGANTAVDGFGIENTDKLIRVFASSVGTPDAVLGTPSQYTFSALVDQRGVVHSYTTTYQTRLDGTTLYVTNTVWFTSVGGTAVDRPPWLSAALNATN